MNIKTPILAAFACLIFSQTQLIASPLHGKTWAQTIDAQEVLPLIKVTSGEPYLLIISVKCNSTTLGSDTDNIYFSISNGLRHPRKGDSPFTIREGQVWKPHFFLSASKAVDISLMESDIVGADDKIGTFRFDPKRKVGRYSEKLDGDFSNYEIIFEVR